MPSQIVEAEYLYYRNPARNSDKVFNIFLVEEDNGTYSCISEYGRRGACPVRVVVCSNRPHAVAETAFRNKLDTKRNHRETPYQYSPDGPDQSPFAREFAPRPSSINHISTPKSVDPPETQKQAADRKMRNNGILNQGQIDSLEL